MRYSTILFLVSFPLLGAEGILLKVIDPQGLPVPDATVQARSSGPRTGTGGRTNGRGEVAIRAALPVELRITASGFDPAVRRIETAAAGHITVQLNPAVLQTTLEVVVREEAAPFAPSVGTAIEIDRSGARTVLDAVDRLAPGAFVTRRGVMGYGIATNGTGSVSIRGVGGQPNTGVLVVVDGRPDYQGLMGHPLPDFYSLSDAESVSVTQGPASVLYGSNAMGGVIEVKPSRPRDGMDMRLSSSLGSYMTGQHRFAHGASFGKGFYSIHAGIDHTGGDRESSAYRSKDATVAGGYDLTPSWKASLQGRYGHFHVEDPGPVNAPLANSYARVGRGGFTLNLDNAYSRTWGYARVFSSHGRHIITDGFRSIDNTTGARVLQSFSLTPGLTIDAGMDAVTFGGRAQNIRTHVDYGEHDVNSIAGFSRLQLAPGDRVRLNGGVRYEHHSVFGGITAPEAGATYRISQNYSLGAAVARGFRNPTIREMYLFPAPNPLLTPEELWNYQATFHARPHNAVQTMFTAYYADLNNMIVTTGRFPNLALRNSGSSINRGLEGTVRWRPVRRLHLNSGYAYLRSTNMAPYIPGHKWNSSIDLDAGPAILNFGTSVIGKRWADTRRTATLGGYTVGTMKCTLPIRPRYSLFVMVDNLFSRRYEVLPGYPMPGTNALGGVTMEFH